MQQAIAPIVQDLVLVGGGHSHAIALKIMGMKPLPGVRVTLITDTSHTPYSGMLPGHVAGFYSFDQTHIDLRRLAGFAQAQLYIDKAVGLDLDKNQVLCAHRPPVSFDYLSIDIGSTPEEIAVPGAADYAIPAKPVPQLLSAWYQLLEEVASKPEKPLSIGIVGGGAGGVELAMNMQSHLHRVLRNAQQPIDNLKIHLFHRGAELLPGHNRWVSQRLEKILTERGIELHLQESVSEVFPHKVVCESGLTVECNHIFWVTTASAPSWIEVSGLATDSRGFVLVGDTLQSVSHPHILAAGDVATMRNHSRPKAGVFAVRQGKPLYKNLRRILSGKPLKPYVPQKRYLSLIGTGDKRAIASWESLGWHSPLLWRWKDHIDRKFMRRFEDLPEMGQGSRGAEEQRSRGEETHSETISPPHLGAWAPPQSSLLTPHSNNLQPAMHCAGCGSKVGSTTLERVLQRLQVDKQQDIIVGLDTPDDAAVAQVPAGQLMVHTIDYFRSLINDPYIFGQIATNHCLSDIFAMGATPQSVLAVVTVPYAAEDKVAEILYQLLAGATQALQLAQTPLVGGHTTEGSELAFGLSCNGLVPPEQLLRKSGMNPGHVLILNKAIGTGTLFAADMRYKAKGDWIDQAVESMLLSNQAAAQVFIEHGTTALTDITGFGLLGHLMEMIRASGVAVELDLEAIPVLAGARETVQRGITSSLQPQNLQASAYINNVSEVSALARYPLLFDPQTAGGLLAAIPAEKADSCLAALQVQGYGDSRLIGRIMPAKETLKPVTILR